MDLEIDHMDVTTAFLNAKLKEDIYMEQPEGFASKDRSMVFKLKKAIYGIKQAPNEWNSEINLFLLNILKFNRCLSDNCIYTKMSTNNKAIIIGLFVDDIIIIYDVVDTVECSDVKLKLMSKYVMKDLGKLIFYLELKLKEIEKIK